MCSFKRGVGEKEGVVFLKVVDIPMHTMSHIRFRVNLQSVLA